MAERGRALDCTGPNGPFGHREAWFVDIFGRHEMHLLPNADIRRVSPDSAQPKL